MGDDQRTIWCGNLAEKVTEAMLYELFLQLLFWNKNSGTEFQVGNTLAGPLQRVAIPTDRDGRQRSYAFITYKDECSVPYALSLFEDTKMFNRVLSLSEKSGKAPESVDRGVNGLNFVGDRHINAPVPQMACKDVPGDFNLLLQLGQQLMTPSLNLFGGPFPQLTNMNNFPMYASQMGGQNYLGGAMNAKNSNHGYQHARNHPYEDFGKGSPRGTHGHDNYHNNGRNVSNKNYHRSGRY